VGIADRERLNAATTDQPFYMPRVEEVLEGVGQASCVSKLDLTKGYYQVQVAPEDVPKTAFVCHRGQFEFERMPFGVKNAPACFQVVMQNLFRDHRNCTPYMDDLIIYSNTWEEHLVHITTKCVWGGKTVEFLGHKVGGGKMSLPKHRAEAFTKYSLPATKKGLRSFLGAVSFYRRYIKMLATHTAKLSPLTSKLAPAKVVWSEGGELAFRTIVSLICNTCMLCIPLPEDDYSIVDNYEGQNRGTLPLRRRPWQWWRVSTTSPTTSTGISSRFIVITNL